MEKVDEKVDLNYEADVKIDIHALDVEWVNQPVLMRKYTELAAKLGWERDVAKEYLAQLKADLEMKIRSNPDKYGLTSKVTEAGIASTILLQKSYQAAVQKLINAEYEFKTAQGVVQAFDQRRSALENLVKLLGQGYFAGPKAPRDLSPEAFDSLKESVNHTKRREANKAVRMTRTRKGGS